MRQRISVRAWVAVAVAAVAGMSLAGPASADKRYRDDVFKKVKVQRDLVYGTGLVNAQPLDLRLDLYTPKGDAVTKRAGRDHGDHGERFHLRTRCGHGSRSREEFAPRATSARRLPAAATGPLS